MQIQLKFLSSIQVLSSIFIGHIALESCGIFIRAVKSQDASRCRRLDFTSHKAFDGERLINHVIHVHDVSNAKACWVLCYLEADCVSYNFEKQPDGESGMHSCELNNSTHEGHDEDLVGNISYFYRGAESACIENPCKNDSTCQSGFTNKGFRCLCHAGFKGQFCDEEIDECREGTHNCSLLAVCRNTKGSYNCTCKPGYHGNGRSCSRIAVTCQEVYESNRLNKSGVVTLYIDSKKMSIFCHVGEFGCGDGGWTPVLKMNGSKETFHYKSPLWTSKYGYNFPGGETGFDSLETKLPTYWNTSFKKICLGMKIGKNANFIVIEKPAESLYSLIADGQHRKTSLGRDEWKKLIGSEDSLQPNCNREGFNPECRFNKVRIGILGNNEDDCNTCDSRIGFGTGGNPDDKNTCGNVNRSKKGRRIKAIGYILIK
ncbi:uncharacterized protein LOC111341092 [Stylophora pistillata]|uniref:uncharacterized protein LOC111341092 n=1 Tax=Stylophora pistillata TaxID=50429 RepID=UPI000C0487E7|nr:uncharacterized protein LOC111341092 [Stylophora pistillata]